jgi:hypothetical protein
MSTGRHTFKHTEATRLIRATEAAGLKVKGVTIKDGKPYCVIEHDAPDTDANNPFDAEAEKLRKGTKAPA